MAIVIPEVVLIRILNALNKHYWEDYQTNLADPTKSLYYNMFGGLEIDGFNYFENAVEIFTNHFKVHQKPMTIQLGYSPARMKNPSVSLLLPNEEVIGEGINVTVGMESMTNINGDVVYRETRSYPYKCTYAILISSENANEVMILYHYFKSILLAAMEQFELEDWGEIRISGKDHTMMLDLLPEQMHHRTVDFTFSYTNELWGIFESAVSTAISYGGNPVTGASDSCLPAQIYVNSDAVGSVDSGGEFYLAVVNELGAVVGYWDALNERWVVPAGGNPNITVNSKNTLGTVVATGTYVANGTYDQTVPDTPVSNSDDSYVSSVVSGVPKEIPDTTIVLKNSLGAIQSTTPVPSAVSNDIVASNTPVSNSDDSYVSSVVLGVEKELPDVTMTQPNGSTTSYPSVKNFSCTQIASLLNADLISQLTDAQVQAIYEGRVTINEVTFTTIGSTNYDKPANLLFAVVMCIGGGGGGGSGQRRASGTAAAGGGGGGNSGLSRRIITNAEIVGTQTVIVGSGGTGGAGRTTDGTQNGGTNGGSSSFGALVLAPGGNVGANGTGTGGALTSHAASIPQGLKANIIGGIGANGGATAAGSSGQISTSQSPLIAQGGAGGGGATNSTMTTAGNGGNSGRNYDASYVLTTATTSGAGSTIGDGGDGGASADNTLLQISLVQDLNTTIGYGNPGAGGGASTVGNGGSGSNGGLYGMGGGGGGGCVTGFTSGKGGDGGQGCVIIHEFLV